MNKKLLFGFMSLAALAACTNDDFESQNVVAEEKSPIQFEVINNAEVMRASMNGSKIAWSAADGDLFTLYHGDCTTTSYQNATYKAEMGDGGSAVLTTPSMIKQGKAIMTWPVDTAFKQGTAALQISVPDVQTNIENSIPYVSDVINIGAYNANAPYNTAGYARKYPIYMRPMASQLTIKADYAGTESQIAELYTGANAIDPIKVTDIKLVTTTGKFTAAIPLTFTAATPAVTSRWNAAEPNNAWSDVVGFGAASATYTEMTAKGDCLLDGNQGCKFLILPQSTADATSAVVVNTIYGKVVVAPNGVQGSQYVATTEDADIWYRYISNPATALAGETAATAPETSGDNAGKYKTTANIQVGMNQTFGAIDANKAPATDKYVAGEDMGGAATRYVKVLLKYLDMSALHITSDKQLRDAARVWQHIGAGTVIVFLDGDDNKEFKMSRETIKAINEINAAAAEESRQFVVKPCTVTGEACNTIVITGGGDVPDMTFITKNGTKMADIAFNEGETWNWKGTVKVRHSGGALVNSFINRGTMNNAETATLKVTAPNGTTQLNVPFKNNGTWNITAGTVNVQFDVTNYGIVNIASGAQYRQDGTIANTVFTNEATDLPKRFGGDDSKIGVVNNSGVFATVNNGTITTGKIINYGLIEHATENAKTFITENQTTGATFANAFNNASGSEHKMGRINLPYTNKDEENISISNGVAEGFVSVTIDGGVTTLNTTAVGSTVNYIIVNSGITSIAALPATLKYVEINQPNTEIVWDVNTATYTGLIVLSDVNISRGKAITSTTTYLGADMYVGGTFTCADYAGYYGDTSAKESTNIITY